MPSPLVFPQNHLTNCSSPPSTIKAIGDVKTTNVGSAFGSLLPKKHFGSPASAPVVVPPAFPRQKSSFGPPPVRRVPSQSEPEPEPEAQEAEREEGGEYAKVLYDFDSSEKGDLPLKEGQKVRVAEHTSEDWWTGELDGRTGLFPSAYVELV